MFYRTLAVALMIMVLWACLRSRSKAYMLGVLLACAPLIFGAAGIFFQLRSLNFCVLLSGIAGYIYFAFASFSIRPKLLGIATGIVFTTPVVLAILILPAGGLGVMFILGDIAAPYSTVEVRDGVQCRIKEIGNAAAGDGVQVELVRPLWGFAYKTMYENSYMYSQASPPAPCEYAYARLGVSRR
jgi:hypothetical protein